MKAFETSFDYYTAFNEFKVLLSRC